MDSESEIYEPKPHIKERMNEVLFIFLNDENATIRSVGKQLCVSKSTIHKDIVRFKNYDPEAFLLLRDKLDDNLNTRHIKGGLATRKRWYWYEQSEN